MCSVSGRRALRCGPAVWVCVCERVHTCAWTFGVPRPGPPAPGGPGVPVSLGRVQAERLHAA